MTRKGSIRHKIIFGYGAIGAIIVALSIFTFLEIHELEKQVLAGDRISQFLDAVLEFRRFEKNYILYRQDMDFLQNTSYVQATAQLLQEHDPDFSSLIGADEIAALQGNISAYRERMLEYRFLKSTDTQRQRSLEQEVRMLGKAVLTVAEETSKTERKRLQEALTQSRNLLLYSVIVLALLGIVMGQG